MGSNNVEDCDFWLRHPNTAHAVHVHTVSRNRRACIEVLLFVCLLAAVAIALAQSLSFCLHLSRLGICFIESGAGDGQRFSSRASDSVNGDGSGSDDGGHMDESLGGGLSHPGDGNLSSLKEDVVSQWAQESAAHAPSTALGGTPPRPGGMLRSGSFDRALARKATGLPSKRGSPGGPSPSCAEPVCNRRNSDGGAAALEIAGTMVRSNSFGAMGARGHRRVASSGADAV